MKKAPSSTVRVLLITPMISPRKRCPLRHTTFQGRKAVSGKPSTAAHLGSMTNSQDCPKNHIMIKYADCNRRALSP